MTRNLLLWTAMLVTLMAMAGVADAFAPTFSLQTTGSGVKGKFSSSVVVESTKRDDDLPREDEEYTGSVDWDAEWKKVVEKEKSGQSIERPGKDFYKSDAEIAAIRAANRAQSEVNKISNKLPSVPSMDMGSLTGDWRFWIAILALISIGSAVLSAPPSYPPVSSGDSYYI